MTELNPAPEPEPAAEPQGAPPGAPTAPPEARADRPALPQWPALHAGAPVGRDAEVESLLVRLETLPALPVADHGEVYARLHADLAEALDGAEGTAS